MYPAVTDILERIHSFQVIPLCDNNFGQINIFCASTNLTKLRSTYNINKKLTNSKSNCCRIIGISVPSGVNEQPIEEETYVGCHNRLHNLSKECEKYKSSEHCSLYAMENGIFVEHNDRCFTISPSTFTYLESPSVRVPDYVYQASKDTDFKVTCGSIIEATEFLKKGTWHEIYDHEGRTREQIISMSVEMQYAKIHDMLSLTR